jgi:hypothetical protein
VGEPREDKDNGHIPSAVTGCLQFGEDATSMTRRLVAEAPKKKLVYQKKKNSSFKDGCFMLISSRVLL